MGAGPPERSRSGQRPPNERSERCAMWTAPNRSCGNELDTQALELAFDTAIGHCALQALLTLRFGDLLRRQDVDGHQHMVTDRGHDEFADLTDMRESRCGRCV